MIELHGKFNFTQAVDRATGHLVDGVQGESLIKMLMTEFMIVRQDAKTVYRQAIGHAIDEIETRMRNQLSELE